VAYGSGILWQSSYTGLARYEEREWRSYFKEDSGLASNFINFVRARGRSAWLATDDGLSLTDGDRWVTYRRLQDGRGETLFFEGARRIARRVTPTSLAHNYVLGVDADENEIWAGTGAGISRGRRAYAAKAPWTGPTAPREAQARGAGRPADSAAGFHYAMTPDELLPYRGNQLYKRFFTERSQFRGSGREEPAPAGLDVVRLGFIGPLTYEEKPVLSPASRPGLTSSEKAGYGRRMLRAARLAIEEANRRGGYRGLPFELVPRTDLVLWGQTSNELTRVVFDDGVWAVLSSIDRTTAMSCHDPR